MKQIFFLLLVTFTFVLATNSCTSDDSKLPKECSKKELLIAKSKELAKKYNVRLSLDLSKLDEASEELTIEQMEQIYQNWANMDSIVIYDRNTKESCHSKNGIRLHRHMIDKEVSPIKNGYFFKCEGKYKEAPVEADLTIYNRGVGHITIYIYSAMIHDLISSGSGDFGDVIGGYNSAEDYSFSGKTDMFLNGISHYFTGTVTVKFSCTPIEHIVYITR